MKKAILLISLFLCQHAFSQTVRIYRFEVSGDVPTLDQAREAVSKNMLEGLQSYTAVLDERGGFALDMRKALKNGDANAEPVGLRVTGRYSKRWARVDITYFETILTSNKFAVGKPVSVKPIITQRVEQLFCDFDGEEGYSLSVIGKKEAPIRTMLLITVNKAIVAMQSENTKQVAAHNGEQQHN